MRQFCFLLVALCCLLSGCNGEADDFPITVPAEGIVRLDGTAVDGATIIFIGEAGIFNGNGKTDGSGNFKIHTKAKPGVIPGKYQVEISKADLPKRYASATTSGLSAELGDQGNSNLKFELSSKAK